MINGIILMAATLSPSNSLQAQVDSVLNNFHQAASEAKFEEYFGHFTDDGVFIGTDAEERWPVKSFKEYARPHFAKGKGWTYRSKKRNISLAPDNKVAWFDEILENEKYGTSRGSGVLVLEKAKWKIAQYHLIFPVPNDLAEGITKEIKAIEKTKSLPKESR